MRGRPGECRDLPDTEQVAKLITHRYLEAYDPDADTRSQAELIAEIGQLRAALHMTRNGLQMLDEVHRLQALPADASPVPEPAAEDASDDIAPFEAAEDGE